MPEVVLGVDLGLRRDWTAIAALERVTDGDDARARYDLIHLERGHWELPELVERVAGVRAAALGRFGADSTWLVLDRTGAGEFAVGPFRDAGLDPVPICITGGLRPTLSCRATAARRTPSTVRAEATVPKRDLVSVLQVLLETGRLRLAADLADLDILVGELETFRARISPAGRDTYEAWREGDHDDTVLATALACWFGERALPCITSAGAVVRIRTIGGGNRATELVQARYRGELA